MVQRAKGTARDPLMEAETAARLGRVMSRLIGLILLLIGAGFVALLWSYSPFDPSFRSATTATPQNALGIVGSYLADPLHLATGWAAYGIPLLMFVWGFRLLLLKGQGRFLSRAIFVPIAVAASLPFLAAHIPPGNWGYPYGLGGIFGDMALGEMLKVMPVSLRQSLWILSPLSGLIAIAVWLYVLGVNGRELRAAIRRFRLGLAIFAAALIVAIWGLVRGIFVSGRVAWKSAADRKSARAAAPAKEEQAKPAPTQWRRLLPQVFSRSKSAEPAEPDKETPETEDRLVARISAAVKARESKTAADIYPKLGGVRRDESDGFETYTGKEHTESEEAADTLAPAPTMGTLPVAERSEPRVRHPERKEPALSRQAQSERQPSFSFDEKKGEFEVPPLSLLEAKREVHRQQMSDDALNENARMLESVLDDYGVRGDIVSVRPGPVVTMYELEPAAGLKASRVIGLADDIARSMSALSARVSTIPGRSVIGIELPNAVREKVLLREILSARAYGDSSHPLPLALGKDIGGDPVVANLARMPHLLIAGTTGSGKSVAINTMILSLLYKLTPEDCRMIMIDPKMLELSVYDGIPHLLSPVVTDPKKAVVALKWVVGEMEERYRKMSKMGVRNIDGFNGRVQEALEKGEGFSRTVQTGFDDATGEPVFETQEYEPEKLPYIVVIVDEMADLMMVAGKEIEACIQRLAQMARAAGIHLIMATQRPSVDVITGTIKANFPTRISFQVTSKVDSRTILSEQGAEQLLGQGDMLHMAAGGKINRVHGPFVSDEEVEEIVNFLKSQGTPAYVSGVVDGPDSEEGNEIDLKLGLIGGNTDGDDAMYDQAVAIVARDRKCSTSYIQRKLSIGYNKAAKLVEQMEEEGIVSAANHVGKREILIPEAH